MEIKNLYKDNNVHSVHDIPNLKSIQKVTAYVLNSILSGKVSHVKSSKVK